jgi:hypothetical protein
MPTLSFPTIEIITGFIFLFVAIVGGGFSAKEIEIPKLPKWGRISLAGLGIACIVGAAITNFLNPTVLNQNPNQSPGSSSSNLSPASGRQCRRIRNIPQVDNGTQTEDQVRNFLTAQGWFNVLTAPAFDPGAPKGLVVDQEPAPGTLACPRDQITIKVTR